VDWHSISPTLHGGTGIGCANAAGGIVTVTGSGRPVGDQHLQNGGFAYAVLTEQECPKRGLAVSVAKIDGVLVAEALEVREGQRLVIEGEQRLFAQRSPNA
jgi:hypothetical protein